MRTSDRLPLNSPCDLGLPYQYILKVDRKGYILVRVSYTKPASSCCILSPTKHWCLHFIHRPLFPASGVHHPFAWHKSYTVPSSKVRVIRSLFSVLIGPPVVQAVVAPLSPLDSGLVLPRHPLRLTAFTNVSINIIIRSCVSLGSSIVKEQKEDDGGLPGTFINICHIRRSRCTYMLGVK